jgi:hypothetical protein
VTEADKADFADTTQCSIASPAGQIPGRSCDGNRRDWLVFGHGGSWPGATHLLMRTLGRIHPLSGEERILPLSRLAALLSFLA